MQVCQKVNAITVVSIVLPFIYLISVVMIELKANKNVSIDVNIIMNVLVAVLPYGDT